MVGPQLLNHRSHSIHVGAPDVNIDVHTTREHVARHFQKQVRKYLMCMLSFPVLHYYTKLPGHCITPIKNSIFRVILIVVHYDPSNQNGIKKLHMPRETS